jgi:hypothetical protein
MIDAAIDLGFLFKCNPSEFLKMDAEEIGRLSERVAKRMKQLEVDGQE